MEQTKRGLLAPGLLLIAVLTLALSFGVLAASSFAPGAADQAHAASISKKSVTVTKGKTYKLKLKKVTAKKVKWSSSKKSVATVSKSGTVKAKKAGKATITAKYKGKKYKCKVTVVNPVSGHLGKVMTAIEKSPDSASFSKGITALIYYEEDVAAIVASDRNARCVKFALVVEQDNADVTISMSVYGKSSVPAEVAVETKKRGNLKASTTLSKSTYKPGSKSQSWKLKKYSKKLGYTSKEAKNKCNAVLKTSFEVWDELLKSETGYSLKYLGFKKA